MLQNNRIFLKVGASLSDLSIPLSDYLTKSGQLLNTGAQGTIYIGSDLPFNHRWFELTSVNAMASSVSVHLWNGSQWAAAVDVIDQTKIANKTFAKSGHISWTPDKYESWDRAETTQDIPDLAGVTIYDLFWAKLSFTSSLSPTTAIRYIGHKFSDDRDLFSRYANLSNTDLIEAFAEDKRDWLDQHFIAAEELIQHLRANRTIISPNQILRFEQFKTAAVHKCAEVIYRSFGEDYAAEMKNATAAFTEAMKIGSQNIDHNADATLQFYEKNSTTEFMDR